MVPARLCWKKSTCPFTVLKTQDGTLTVWQGTVSGLWLGAVAAVCLICRLRCSTQSCRSCWFVHTTWSRSNIGPAGDEKRQRRSPTCDRFKCDFQHFRGRPTVELERVFVSVTVVQFGHRHAGQGQFPLQRGITGKQNVTVFSCRAAHFEFQGIQWKKINTIL